MELTAKQVLEVTPVITTLINENRAMPLKGKYRLGRWHMKLKPEWDLLQARRDGLIKSYDNLLKREEEDPETGERKLVEVPDTYQVPDNRMAEFNEAWGQIESEVITFGDMKPIPFEQLDLGDEENGSISAIELVKLAPLIAD